MDRVNNLIEVRESKFGRGLFAVKDIPPFTVVCTIEGRSIRFKETLLLGEKESHSLQVGIDHYILCESPFLFSNHSCEPNSGINSRLQLFSLRTINKDEEILWDYSTSMLERHWTMSCSCGVPTCRKFISDFDFLPVDLQQLYIKKKVVLPFILEHLQYKIAI